MTRARTLADLGSASLATDAELAAEVATLDSTISGLALGKVLQVVQASYATSVTNNTSTYADTGLSASITPSSSSSKILVIGSQWNTIANNSERSIFAWIQLVRNGSQISEYMSDYINADYGTAAYVESGNTLAISYLDSPNTTSSVTYKTQARKDSSPFRTSMYIVTSRGYLTLIEVAQ